MPAVSAEEKIVEIYSALTRAWGPQHWWPAQSRFEVIVGAYLTQNTSWTNVEIALKKLRAAKMLNLEGIRRLPMRRLEQLIRSSGYFRQKARKLKIFVKFLDRNYGGSLTNMFAQPTAKLREQLLALNGVGPETADSILLYAGQHPVFVVDAYTRRLATRHGILHERSTYEDFRHLFESALGRLDSPSTPSLGRNAGTRVLAPSSQPGMATHSPSRMSAAKRTPLAQAFNEMHGLIVSAGKQYCLKAKGRCESCPLGHLLKIESTPPRQLHSA